MVWVKEEKNSDIGEQEIIQHGQKINLWHFKMINQVNNYTVITLCGYLKKTM